MSFKVLSLVFPGMTLIDLAGPLQALSFIPGFESQLAWKRTGALPSDAGVSVVATHGFDDCWEAPDLLFVPGNTKALFALLEDEETKAFLARIGAAKGDPLPNTPKFTAALSADYDFDVASHGAGVGATWRHIDDRVSGYDSGSYPNFKLDAYDTLDLRGHVDFGRTTLQLYVKNATDERGQLAATTTLSALGGPATVSILQPRTYGVALRVGF